jgi:hypothetical protein
MLQSGDAERGFHLRAVLFPDRLGDGALSQSPPCRLRSRHSGAQHPDAALDGQEATVNPLHERLRIGADLSGPYLSFLDEILEKHDYSMDAPSGGPEKFRARSLDNFTQRRLHHHVFNLDLLKMIFDFAGIETLRREEISNSFTIVGRV